MNWGTVFAELDQCGLAVTDEWVDVIDGPWPNSQFVWRGVEPFLAVHQRARTLGQMMAGQAVGLLAMAALPRAVRSENVSCHAAVCCPQHMTSHRVVSSAAQGLAHRFSDFLQLDREVLHGQPRAGRLHQHCQKSTLLDQHAQNRAAASHLDGALSLIGRRLDSCFIRRANMDALRIRHLPRAIAREALGFDVAKIGRRVNVLCGAGVTCRLAAMLNFLD